MSAAHTLQPGFIVAHSNHLEELRDLVVQWTKKTTRCRPLKVKIFWCKATVLRNG